MHIFIMRHGHAIDQAASDSQRPLSESGRIEVAKMAAFLQEQQQSFDVIYQSPYTRAQQTAAIVAEQLGLTEKLQTLDMITPMGRAKDVHDFIDGTLSEAPFKNMLFVCHMPIVSYLVESLSAGASSPIFQTAEIAKIAYDPRACLGELVATYSPSSNR
ncbi:phosphohistidine phosphatase SixA [Thalassotalea sp. LPB0316]|uniref:phosphohistidine phosphatase SixA n=1 Tax=Thalassotalea sp. LPB0316 TaxID=2769490 RepID=UPI00186766BE|nr:phosphohistidine phosphatase SixA [Thalassotalea sp. LPB0316]QOL24450.1 phosphohistidine phosphatase SixA [Thalassotalea sp. LPB0316]